MKPIKCIECEIGVDGCAILSASELTCCYCLWLAAECEDASGEEDALCSDCHTRAQQ